MKPKKIAIVGSGTIGSILAYSLFLKCENIEINLINRDEKKAWAKAFDISHCGAELPNRSIRPVGGDTCHDADVVVMTAGALPDEHGTRADVIKDNVKIYRQLLPAIAAHNPDATLICITNPVDAMAYAARRITGYPAERVIGSGTELDSMRLRTFTAEAFDLDPTKLSIDIVGEHGDSMVPLWSLAQYDGHPLTETLDDFDESDRATLLQKTKRAGWDIRLAGEHSSFGIAFSVTRIIEHILGFSRGTLTVSASLTGEYGLRDTCVSLPTELNGGGIVKRYTPPLSAQERGAFELSARAVRAQMDEVDRLLSD